MFGKDGPVPPHSSGAEASLDIQALVRHTCHHQEPDSLTAALLNHSLRRVNIKSIYQDARNVDRDTCRIRKKLSDGHIF